jgi:hypothetical protein
LAGGVVALPCPVFPAKRVCSFEGVWKTLPSPTNLERNAMAKQASLRWVSLLVAIIVAYLCAVFVQAAKVGNPSIPVVDHSAVNWDDIPPEPDPSPLSVAAY